MVYPRGKPHPSLKADRNRKIARLYTEDGLSYAAIADRFDLSVERVRQIVRDEMLRATGRRPQSMRRGR